MNDIEVFKGFLSRDLIGTCVHVDVDEPGNFRVFLYTAKNRYSIVCKASFDDSGAVIAHFYLGCTSRSRIMRPGEDWFRGNDLPDGECSSDTWYAILAGIVRHESQQIQHGMTMADEVESPVESRQEEEAHHEPA